MPVTPEVPAHLDLEPALQRRLGQVTSKTPGPIN